MKTFEEAFEVTTRFKPGEDHSVSIHNSLDVATDIATTERARVYIRGMCELMLAAHDADEAPVGVSADAEFMDFLCSLAMSAMTAGIRIGQEMEREELPQ